MFYVGIVNFGEPLTKGHSVCWDTDDFKALSVNFAFAPWSVRRFRYWTKLHNYIFFQFFTPFNVVNLGFLLIARYMSCKLLFKLAGSSNMNEQLSSSMIIMPNTSNHTVIVWIKIISYK